jgi:hypothetical protein
MTLQEFMQQQAAQKNYFKQDLSGYARDEGGAYEYVARGDAEAPVIEKRYIEDVYGTQEDYQVGDAEAPSTAQRFASRDQELKNAYYADPSNFIQTRETPIATGVNTFNEGNENQKRILDQINTGQLVIVPVNYEVDTFQAEQGEPRAVMTGYELKDARTGETIQQVKAIDADKGIFNVAVNDPNSSGFFNNYVSTDPKGFVNPVVSEQQSQYQSKPNSSANFYRNVLQGTIAMATGVGAFGTTAALATSIGNTLGVTGAGALTVGSAVLGSASSAVLAAVTGGDVVKSAIAGGITAGVGANASDIGTFIAGGADNVKVIADALDLTTKQDTTAISNAVTSGVVSAAVTGTDVTTAVT